MSRTVKGGKSPRQVAAIRGRKLLKEEQIRNRDFNRLKNEGKPSKIGKARG
jgi:hypothetical protein